MKAIMTKIQKGIVTFIVGVMIVTSMPLMQAQSVEAATKAKVQKTDVDYINSNSAASMYKISNYRSGDCYLSACVYMIKRKAYLDNLNWSNVKADTAPSESYGGSGVRSVACTNSSGDGRYNDVKSNFTYNVGSRKYNIKYGSLTGTNAQKTKKLCRLLDKHPEGVAVHGGSAAGYPHAVLITHYTKDSKGNIIFYCVDSSNNTASYNSKHNPKGYSYKANKGVQKLSASTIKTQSGQLYHITNYRYIDEESTIVNTKSSSGKSSTSAKNSTASNTKVTENKQSTQKIQGKKFRFSVRVSSTDIYRRTGPGTNYAKKGFWKKGIYEIVYVSTGRGAKAWGMTSEGLWIALDYTTRIDKKITVRIDEKDLRIRTGAGTNYSSKGFISPGVYQVTDIKPGKGSDRGFGYISGKGWVSLDYVLI